VPVPVPVRHVGRRWLRRFGNGHIDVDRDPGSEPASDNIPITTSDTFLAMMSPSITATLVDPAHHIDSESGISLRQVGIGLSIAEHKQPTDHPFGRVRFGIGVSNIGTPSACMVQGFAADDGVRFVLGQQDTEQFGRST